jgi:glycosyltransferase involved in cell wall biosynthesis
MAESKKLEKVIAVLPAYNAELTLEKTVLDIPEGCVDVIILTDDGSTDKTVEIAERLSLTVIRHEKNVGYGANQKTCYAAALADEADAVVMIHPDYQYDSRLVPYALGFLSQDVCDVVIGSRIRSRREALDGGMPLYKYIFNRMLTIVENVVLGQNLGDFHSGFRAYTREVLETIPFKSNSDRQSFLDSGLEIFLYLAGIFMKLLRSISFGASNMACKQCQYWENSYCRNQVYLDSKYSFH